METTLSFIFEMPCTNVRSTQKEWQMRNLFDSWRVSCLKLRNGDSIYMLFTSIIVKGKFYCAIVQFWIIDNADNEEMSSRITSNRASTKVSVTRDGLFPVTFSSFYAMYYVFLKSFHNLSINSNYLHLKNNFQKNQMFKTQKMHVDAAIIFSSLQHFYLYQLYFE